MTLQARVSDGWRAWLCCSACGHVPVNPIERVEVAMTWLLPETDASQGPVERRFCRSCAPSGPVADVECVRCGDGPLLAGDLAGADVEATTLVQGWMSAAGWRLSGPVCPDCVGELAR